MSVINQLEPQTQQLAAVFRYDDLHLVALPTAVGCARMFAHLTLPPWGVGDASIAAVEQVAVQLVAGAVQTTGIPGEPPAWTELTSLNRLVVRLRQDSMRVVVEVWDVSQEPPFAPPPVGYRSGYFTLEAGGKVVWVEVPYEQATAKPLPKRVPSPVARPGRPVEHVADTELLGRLLDGFREL